jgi:hypothetical protein
LKSVCTVYQDLSYDNAKLACSTVGMKLFVANTTEEINAITRYTDIHFPYGLFWVEGKNGTNCAVMSNNGRIDYKKTQTTCTANAYFNCEYQSK